MEKPIPLTLIDFAQPWWRIITQQTLIAIPLFLCVIVRDVFWVTAPFLITLILEKGSWSFFGLFCSGWVALELLRIVQYRLNGRFQLHCIHSLFYSAHQYLLVIDPIFHVKRSSGVILAKIDRAARGYEDLLDQVTYEFIPLITGVVTMVVILSYYSWWLLGAVCCCLVAMVAYAYYFTRYACQKWENNFIASDDSFKSTAYENLAQIQLIRATFATHYMRDRLVKAIGINSGVEQDLWFSYARTSIILSLLYTVSILILLAFFMHRVHGGLTSLSFAVGIMLAYVQSTKQLIKILSPLRHYMRGFAAIKDLFASIPQFGTQTIPVLNVNDQVIEKKTSIDVYAQEISFNYGVLPIFDGHSLVIRAPADHQNNLYGIIGPSGVGKTTLISMLGGQLKPLQGTIIINGVDMYTVGDAVRQQLIALQGQIASSIKGTVRSNLLFGLPHDHGYTDAYLLDILKRVGLQEVLAQHQGLDTMLGEGALNISGGQRQRLNFAGLYLRAHFYKPVLILVDEPTSSLDEISELAITHMINQLATMAITLVIAHRLKTLENAVGLIDLSLLKNSKKIEIYTPQDLEKYSPYYQQLVQGNGICLDE